MLYWLDICEEPGDLVAEGSIHGSEELMRKAKKAKRAILEPEAGIFGRPPLYAAKHPHPVVILVGYRAHNGCSYGRTIIMTHEANMPDRGQ